MTDTLSYSDFSDEIAKLYLPKGGAYTLDALLAMVKETLAENARLRELVEFERDVEPVDLDATSEHLLRDMR